MCAHAFQVFGDVRAREGFGLALRVFAKCVKCGTPVKFDPAAGVQLEAMGLVAALVCEPAGD